MKTKNFSRSKNGKVAMKISMFGQMALASDGLSMSVFHELPYIHELDFIRYRILGIYSFTEKGHVLLHILFNSMEMHTFQSLATHLVPI